MATDTAHVDLELASGRCEVTAPFQETAQRRRHQAQQTFVELALPSNAPIVIDVPLSSAQASRLASPRPEIAARPGTARPTWIALIAATLAVAAAVWWIMLQRLPDIDPREVIQRNLVDARTAMAEGRYTDPAERSAFHYYSTVLALDPANADAIAGIDAIADRHLTDARVLLAGRRVAEAGHAIEKARRVRPNHGSLPALDAELRAELRNILAAANWAIEVGPAKTKVAKVADVSPARAGAPSIAPTRPLPTRREPAVASRLTAPSESKIVPAASSSNAAKAARPLLALAPANLEPASVSLITPVIEPTVPTVGESGGAPIVDEPAITSAAQPSMPQSTSQSASPSASPSAPPSVPAPVVQTVEPKLVKMVQPEYPQEAIMRGIEGWVDVSLQVNGAGDVVEPRIEDSSRGRVFNRAALTAVQQWKYEPRAGGQDSERVHVRLQFRFSD